MKTDSDWQLPNSVCLVNNHRIRLWVSCVAFELYLNKAAVKAKTYAITKSLCGLQRARDWGCFPAHHHLLFHLHSFQTFAEGLLLVKSYGGHLEIEQESAVPPSSHCSWGITHWTTGQEAARVLSGTLLWVVDWKHFFKKKLSGRTGVHARTAHTAQACLSQRWGGAECAEGESPSHQQEVSRHKTLEAKKRCQPYPGILSGSIMGVSILFICFQGRQEQGVEQWTQVITQHFLQVSCLQSTPAPSPQRPEIIEEFKPCAKNSKYWADTRASPWVLGKAGTTSKWIP